MRIALVCNDTRGGIQPYVALGIGLQRAGHEVRGVAPAHFAPLFAQASLPMAPLSGSSEAEMRSATQVAERGTLAAMRLMAQELPRRIRLSTRETLDACEGVDLLTGGVGGMVTGLSVAEKLGVPFIETHLQPIGAPTDAYPGVMLAGVVPGWSGGWGRRLSHPLSELAVWLPFRGAMRAARSEVLGLKGKPRMAAGQPVLYGFSPLVVPMPTDGVRPRLVTGYWTLPSPPTWRPPSHLEAFLVQDDRRAIVSIGFGSMSSSDPAKTTALVLGAVRDAGVRAVLLSGWGGLRELPADTDDVFCAEELPHEWLFGRVAAVVHHGGAGTTGAALRAGVPAVVVPFGVDQPFWGGRVNALGVGPQPIPRRQLTGERLAGALRLATTDEAMRVKAAVLGASIRKEDGVGAAVECFAKLGL